MMTDQEKADMESLKERIKWKDEYIQLMEAQIKGQKDHIRRLEERPLLKECEHYGQRLAFAETFIESAGMGDHYNWVRSIADAGM